MSAAFLHLTLRGRDGRVLVQDERDWRELAAVVERMLFWCGGAIHGCRCEGDEVHFALQLAYAPLGQVVRRLSGGYASYLRRRRGWVGGVFKRHQAIHIDADLYWDELVLWLHQPRLSKDRRNGSLVPCWTGDAAYRQPGALPWISTGLVLKALGGSGVVAYRRRLAQPIAPEVVGLFTRASRAASRAGGEAALVNKVDLDRIVASVAAASGLTYADLCSASRKRSVAKAKAVATVLSVRHGASAAAMARLFGRSRSTLSEQVEHYRLSEPRLYLEVECVLARRPATSPAAESETSSREIAGPGARGAVR